MQWSEIPQQLRAWRKDMGLTQDAVAERLGISKQHVSNIETGARSLPPELLGPWVELLGRKLVQEIVPVSWQVVVEPPEISRLTGAWSHLSGEEREVLERLARVLPRMPRAARAALANEVREWERDLLEGEEPQRG